MDFLVVYIKEAYPEDGWVVSMNRDENIVIEDPVTKEDRVDAAESCAINLAVKIPVLVDEMDDRIASAYGALPDRLYLINQDGQIEFQGEPGPWSFDPNQLEAAIEELFLGSRVKCVRSSRSSILCWAINVLIYKEIR